ncbi:MFS transporter [Streptosporangium sp. NPDC087985]|uniref:MFS transporter n=1 Tax=Streptosporangium sp. NPDC087985 TaxID=3366196 RepID=UPI00382C59E6
MLGVVAHLFAGGVVSVRTAACGLVVAFVVALPATGRERGTGVILPLLTGVQVALHLLLSAAPSLAPLAEMGGHGRSGLVPGLGMLVMHGWAAALTALWLARGEAALWAVLGRLAVRLCRLLVNYSGVVHTLPGAGRADCLAAEILRPALLRHAVSRRGPPVPSPVSG